MRALAWCQISRILKDSAPSTSQDDRRCPLNILVCILPRQQVQPLAHQRPIPRGLILSFTGTGTKLFTTK